MIGIIIQARMGSSRLPGKVIKRIEGKTALEHIIERLKRIKGNKKIILATTDKKEDDILEIIGKKNGAFVFRGSEKDVLDRFYQASKILGLRHIVRITADCPLIDPNIVEKTVDFYFDNKFDYVGNSHPPTFPDGMDAEIFSFETLEKCWENAKTREEREHVTLYILKNIQNFKIGNYSDKEDFSDLRLTLDEKEDLTLIAKIYKELYKNNPNFGLKEIIELFDKKPELLKINEKINPNSISRWQKNQKKI